MRRILVLCAAVLVAAAGALIYHLTRPAHFGSPFAGAEAVTVQELLDHGELHLAGDVRVEGRVVRQCPATGCWFDLDARDGRQLRVEMSHLGLTLPQKTGRIAVVEGRLAKTDGTLELVGNGVEFR